MKILLLGATGATGRLLATELLQRGHTIVAIVRSPEKLPESVSQHSNCTVVKNTILEMSHHDLVPLVSECDAAVSCLGHNISLAGIYGKPRMLVTDTLRRIITAARTKAPGKPFKFILMNSAGVRNKEAAEPISSGHKFVLRLLRMLVPPHADNEQAAGVLQREVGKYDPVIEWVAVRPDTLINEDAASAYEVHPSPTRSAIFNPGKTSRINVARFMAELFANNEAWQNWKYKMPVIYNEN